MDSPEQNKEQEEESNESECIKYNSGSEIENMKTAPQRKDTEITDNSSDLESGGSYQGDNVLETCDLERITENPSRFNRRCCGRCIFFTAAVLVTIFLAFTIAIFAGSRVEKKRMLEAKSTVNLYNNDTSVCAFDEFETAMTFRSTEDAQYFAETSQTPQKVAHCGTCGMCSTSHDIDIYAKTRNSLTGDATVCALMTFLGSKRVSKCFEERVGFTPGCQKCWTDNIACTKKQCKWSCLKYRILGQQNNNGDDLNDCLECDERMCGPAFLECAGANRRQSGIVSDIGRDGETEQCREVDYDWVALAKEAP